MTFQCPHAGCKGVDFIEMRPLYRYRKGWFGRKKSGSQVMCTDCLGHALVTPEGIRAMFRPQANPQQEGAEAPPANGAPRRLPRYADLGPEP